MLINAVEIKQQNKANQAAQYLIGRQIGMLGRCVESGNREGNNPGGQKQCDDDCRRQQSPFTELNLKKAVPEGACRSAVVD